jgi:hypothetical protein
MIWLNITPAAKVFRKNVHSFSGYLKSTNAGQKQLESLRILCLFLFESSEEIFEGPKKVVWTGNVFLHFYYWDPKLKVETFVDRSTCRAKFTLQNALFDFLFILQ